MLKNHKRLAIAATLGAAFAAAAGAWASDGDWDDLFKVAAIRTAIFGKLTISGQPGTAESVASTTDAATAAGFPVAIPSWSPETWSATDVFVVTNREMDVSLQLTGLSQALVSLLGLINPTGQSQSPNPNVLQLNTVASPIVDILYIGSTDAVEFAQSASADIVLPSQLNLPVLAEIRLALARHDLGNARRVANAIDWRSAMLVQAPSDIDWTKIVDVNGNPGVLIRERGRDRDDRLGSIKPVSAVFWGAGAQLYGMRGNIEPDDLVSMARSVH